MRILWVTNIVMPTVSDALGEKASVFGGWLMGSAQYLKQSEDLKLAIATAYCGKELWHKSIDGIDYYLVPCHKKRTAYDKEMEKYWVTVNTQFMPDVVHIHGSEYPYGLSYVNACGSKNVVVSIQGMTSVYARYYYAGLCKMDILKNITIADLLWTKTIFGGHKEFVKRGKLEIELIKKIKHVIGRTSWDKMHTQAIQQGIDYHFCNETLRNSFYDGEWNYENCEKHTIFVPQAWYPIKGLHKVIDALSIVKKLYPDVKLRIAGADITKQQTIKQKLLLSGYGKIVLKKIQKLNLQDNVSFTGLLNEEQMKREYLNANVFVCPSSIENSPNSLGEAQILGTPCIAAFVGGIGDMLKPEETGFIYRFDDTEMLAGYICDVFGMRESILQYCNKGRKAALERHDGATNCSTLINIYNEIVYADKKRI